MRKLRFLKFTRRNEIKKKLKKKKIENDFYNCFISILTLIMNNENKRCAVCFEEGKMSYECDICSEGKMCSSCYIANWCYCECKYEKETGDFLEYGRECHIEERELLTEIIKCPCCRSLNWKPVYSSMFDELIESDYVMFKKNTSNYIQEFADKLNDWWIKNTLLMKSYKKVYQVRVIVGGDNDTLRFVVGAEGRMEFDDINIALDCFNNYMREKGETIYLTETPLLNKDECDEIGIEYEIKYLYEK